MSQSAKSKVLLVEDDLIQLNLLCHIFEQSDLDVEIFQTRSPTIAIDIALAEHPDLVITDWRMPEINGLELMERLKSHEQTRDIAVIMCSGVHLSIEDLKTSLSSGAIDYVRKPINSVELLARVATMLRLCKQHQTIKNKNHALEQEIRQHRITMDKLKMSEDNLKQSLAENQRLARLDILTELPNRRACIEQYEAMSSMATRKGLSMAVAIADIDMFKKVNDHYGHDCGDFVLLQAAGVFKQVVRGSDFVGRWGGEEFIFYFIDVDAAGALNVAEKVRQSIASHTIKFAHSELTVTVSLGIAFATDNMEAVTKAADNALYRCKENGRNCVEFVEEESTNKVITSPC